MARFTCCGDDPGGLRDQTMVAVDYDTRCRKSKLLASAAQGGDIERLADGDASILMRCSKTDQASDGGLHICPQER